ncbi:MAG: hypothetical protein P4L40_15525 [Terracidiphilus sp.]|nr:hypothetical protein [Terracidiphilus sp.]
MCAHVAVWVNFRLPGATKILSSFTFTARLLEDCRSHVLSVLIRSDGYCVLSIDGDERARCVIACEPCSIVMCVCVCV